MGMTNKYLRIFQNVTQHNYYIFQEKTNHINSQNLLKNIYLN